MTVKISSNSRMDKIKLLIIKAFGPHLYLLSLLSGKTALGRVVRIGVVTTPLLVAPFVWGALSYLPGAATTSFEDNFESGNYSKWRAGELHTPWDLKIVNGVGTNKTKVARFEYRNTDILNYDTAKADLAGPHVPMGSDQYYSFDFYLPNSFTIARRGPLIFQTHAGLRSVIDYQGGPPIALTIEQRKGDNEPFLYISIRYTKTGKFTGRDDILITRSKIAPLAQIKGSWQKIGLRAKWEANERGRTELYLNGSLRYSRLGSLGFSEPSGRHKGTYPRIGFYMPNKKRVENYADKSVIYFDNFRMGSSFGNFL